MYKAAFFLRDGEKENFPRPLKLVMKASPHDHFSGESAGSAPVPSKGNAEQGDLDSSFLFLTFYAFFPFAHFMMHFYGVSLLTSGLAGWWGSGGTRQKDKTSKVNYFLELLQ